jgi:hypothetical protein
MEADALSSAKSSRDAAYKYHEILEQARARRMEYEASVEDGNLESTTFKQMLISQSKRVESNAQEAEKQALADAAIYSEKAKRFGHQKEKYLKAAYFPWLPIDPDPPPPERAAGMGSSQDSPVDGAR